MLLLDELLILLMLVAALSTTKVRSEVDFQTGLCRSGEGDGGESSCTELEEEETCRRRHEAREDGSTTACDEVKIQYHVAHCIRNNFEVCGKIHVAR